MFAPNLIGIKSFAITSGSMEPLYPVGSLVYTKRVEANQINKNDTITFYLENSEIIATHQVYEIDEENKNFKTQGINNKDEEGNIIHDATPVKFSSLIGKVIFCIPYLGHISILLTTSPGKYIMIATLILIILISIILEKMRKE